MQPVALTLLLALAAPVEAPPAPEPPANPAPSAQRVWGISLLAGGSAALAVTATSAALVEALSRPDDPDAELDNPELMQGFAFGTMLLGAASVAAVLAGGALVITE